MTLQKSSSIGANGNRIPDVRLHGHEGLLPLDKHCRRTIV